MLFVFVVGAGQSSRLSHRPKHCLNPATLCTRWQWERLKDPGENTQRASQDKVSFKQIPLNSLAVGEPDSRQPAIYVSVLVVQ